MTISKSSSFKVLDRIVDLASMPLIRLFQRYRGLEVLVLGSGISTSFDNYAKKSSAITFITMVLASYPLFDVTRLYLRLGITKSIFVALFVDIAIVLPLCLALYIFLPTVMYVNRGAVLEAKFPALALMLSLLLAAGTSLSRAIETLYSRYLDELKVFKVEITMLRSLIRVGVPVDEALRRVARITPSQTLKTLFLDLSATTRIGGDLASAVSNAMSNYIDRYGIRVEKTVNDIGILMESYLSICMLLPMLLGVLAVLFMVARVPGLSFETLMFVTVFILIPIVSIATLVLVDSMVSKLRV